MAWRILLFIGINVVGMSLLAVPYLSIVQ